MNPTSAQSIRNSKAWKNHTAFIKRIHPLCFDPFRLHEWRNREIVPMTEVHHVRPLESHPELAYTVSNTVPLCTTCHAKCTSMERRKIGGDSYEWFDKWRSFAEQNGYE